VRQSRNEVAQVVRGGRREGMVETAVLRDRKIEMERR